MLKYLRAQLCDRINHNQKTNILFICKSKHIQMRPVRIWLKNYHFQEIAILTCRWALHQFYSNYWVLSFYNILKQKLTVESNHKQQSESQNSLLTWYHIHMPDENSLHKQKSLCPKLQLEIQMTIINGIWIHNYTLIQSNFKKKPIKQVSTKSSDLEVDCKLNRKITVFISWTNEKGLLY